MVLALSLLGALFLVCAVVAVKLGRAAAVLDAQADEDLRRHRDRRTGPTDDRRDVAESA